MWQEAGGVLLRERIWWLVKDVMKGEAEQLLQGRLAISLTILFSSQTNT
jgi:hypothetical protein